MQFGESHENTMLFSLFFSISCFHYSTESDIKMQLMFFTAVFSLILQYSNSFIAFSTHFFIQFGQNC